MFLLYLLSQNTNSAKTAPPTLFIKQTTLSEIVQFVIKFNKGENQKYLSVVKADNNDNIMIHEISFVDFIIYEIHETAEFENIKNCVNIESHYSNVIK